MEETALALRDLIEISKEHNKILAEQNRILGMILNQLIEHNCQMSQLNDTMPMLLEELDAFQLESGDE